MDFIATHKDMLIPAFILIIIIIVLVLMELALINKNTEIKQLTILKNALKEEITNRNKAEENLSRFVSIIENSNDAIIGFDIQGKINSWNKAAEKIYGYKENEAIGKHMSLIVPEEKMEEFAFLIDTIKQGEEIKGFETKRKKNDNSQINMSVTFSLLKDSEGNILGLSSIDRDISEKIESEKKLSQSYQELSAVYEQLTAAEQELQQQVKELRNHEEALRISEERYKLAIEGANDAIFEWDFKNSTMFISDKWRTICDEQYIKNNDIKKFFRHIIHEKDLKRAERDLFNHMKGNTDCFQSEFRIQPKSNKSKWIRVRGKLLKNEEESLLKMAGSITDITENKLIQEKINYIAYYDALTSLPNRAKFLEVLDEAIAGSIDKNHKGAVIFLDVDNFKKVNDILGHDYGDEFLKNLAEILKDSIGPSEFIARSGGDEFIILISKYDNITDILELCTKIINYFKNPFIIKGNTVYSSISMGISLFPEDGLSSKEILRNADTAMYEAKFHGRNQFRIFSKTMSENIVRKDIIERGLREALNKKDELMLYYQPQIDISTNKICGFEALVRWKSKELGWVSPAEFIGVAEESDLIVLLGNWIMEEACKQHKEWREKGYEYESMAINISPLQIQHKNFLKDMRKTIVDSYVKPEEIEVEITENVFMSLYDKNIDLLNLLNEKGFRIALDDFGTGYSSLSYLRKLPINKLKIDKSFIDNIEHNSGDKEITSGIIDLAHKMGISVIAEGVETEGQATLLKQMNCDKIQGYFYSRPLPPEEAESYLKNTI